MPGIDGRRLPWPSAGSSLTVSNAGPCSRTHYFQGYPAFFYFQGYRILRRRDPGLLVEVRRLAARMSDRR